MIMRNEGEGRSIRFLSSEKQASRLRHGKSVAGTKISTVTLDQLRASLHQSQPPATLPPLLAALWWEAKGDWNQAHEIAQAENGADAAWVHAYLHRKEGDTTNAAYWYSRAHQPHCTLPLDAEWDQVASALLTRSASARG
jgi:hypothetical protein